MSTRAMDPPHYPKQQFFMLFFLFFIIAEIVKFGSLKQSVICSRWPPDANLFSSALGCCYLLDILVVYCLFYIYFKFPTYQNNSNNKR